jgi:cob(I)alamin adenosyltransferase
MSITTRQGDDGRTRLFSGETVPKSHPRPSAYGDLDEAVSALGLARSLAGVPRVAAELLVIQKTLFLVGAELATSPEGLPRLPARLGPAHLETLDRLGDELEGSVRLPPQFVLPGSTPGSAALDLARSIVRRLERTVVTLGETEPAVVTNPVLIPFLNRLSDTLFLLARYEEQEQGIGYQRLNDSGVG